MVGDAALAVDGDADRKRHQFLLKDGYCADDPFGCIFKYSVRQMEA
jgi:hypothetical protein